MDNLKQVTVFLLDMDGTIYLGNELIDGSKEFLKTLKDKDINKVHDKILRALEYKLGAQLREQ